MNCANQEVMNMEKYQHCRPHPYYIQGSQNAPPPSYDQVYGGGFGPQIIPHNKVHSSVQYHNPACPSRMSALNISYQPQMITSPVPVQNHNGIANGNSIYYPDPRRLMTSSKLSQSTSLNNLNHNISRQDSDESTDHRTCCSFEKATRIIAITCLVLSLIGLCNNIFYWCGSQCGSLGVGVYMLIEYGLNIGVHCILLQGVKKKSDCLVLIWLVFTKISLIITIIQFVFYLIIYKDMMQQGKQEELSGIGLVGGMTPRNNFIGSVVIFILYIIIMTACFFVVKKYRKMIKRG